jgi:hypothetical protein
MTSIHNVVTISDLHEGCQLALCPRDGAMLDNGGWYEPSPMQHKLNDWWDEFWDVAVPEFTHGEPYAVVINGDALDGVHHNSTTQWSHNLNDQARAAEGLLRPIVDRCEGRLYWIRGTEAHVGQSGAEEERLARALGAVPNEYGQYARYELWLRIGGGLAHFTHHIGTAGSMSYESSAVMRELSEAYVQAGRWHNEPPDVVVRSHRHTLVEIRVPNEKGLATAFTTPSWQLRTPFTYRIAGARQALPQIGGSVLRYGGTDLYTRHFVRSLERPKEEIA